MVDQVDEGIVRGLVMQLVRELRVSDLQLEHAAQRLTGLQPDPVQNNKEQRAEPRHQLRLESVERPDPPQIR